MPCDTEKISSTKGCTESGWPFIRFELAVVCYNYLFIHAWNHYYTINAVSSSEVVLLVHLKERILFLGLAVTEININFEINIKKV